MSATLAPERVAPAPTPLRNGYRFELVKLVSQWRFRVLLAICWLGPAAFVAVVGQQSALPADTVFGRWMSQTGWAGPLVVLAFGGSWALPLLTSLVAGDVFASEDRLGTWRHLLVTVRSPRRIFAAKALASLTVIVWLVIGLTVSGVVGGLLAIGNRPLVGLDGHLLSTGDAAGAVLLAWLCALAPTLAFAAVGLLGSVLFGRSPMGLVTPALLAIVLNVAQLLPLPAVVRVALPSYAFIAWRGLFTDPAQTSPVVVGMIVSLVWAAAATALAYRVFVRRDFTDLANDGSGLRALRAGVLPLVAVLAVSVAVVGVATPASGSGIEKRGVDASLATAFGHLYRLQARELHRPDVTERQLQSRASCDKGGSLVEDSGPGNDWRCVVTWRIPGARAVGSAIYQLDITPDARYVADGDGPQAVNGFFQVRTPTGDAPNPLWQFDGLVDLLHPARRTDDAGNTTTPGPHPPRRRLVAATSVALVLTGGGIAAATTAQFGVRQVGTAYRDGLQVSSDQVIKPIGQRLLTKFGKFMGSSVSPDGRYLAAASTDKSVTLQIFDLRSYKLIWTVGTATFVNQKLADSTVGQGAPVYSPDGKFLWLPQKNGLTRFPVAADGTLGTTTTVPLAVDGTKAALPGKPAFSPTGKTLYVPVNGQNTVVALDAVSGKVKQTWPVGIAPREIVEIGTKLYVSNEGGRRARPGETTINSYGTDVPANAYLGNSTNGTLSVIDTAAPKPAVGSIKVGLHPTALYAAGRALFVANTTDDSVSVVNTGNDKVVQTIATKPWPSSRVGYEPTGITLAKGRLLVTLGRANAVAAYRYYGTPQEPVSYLGLLPTDYYPSDIATVGSKVVVSNTRGIDARGPELTFAKGAGTAPATGHGTHSTTASLTRFALPTDRQIARDTATVFKQNGWGKRDVLEAQGRAPKPVPVPKRLGDPSTIKHVFLLVKENRTYDQVYGDIARGNGDRDLAQFGAKVTPNQHALAKQFGLYDNTYDIGTNSAEGHNWLMQGDNPEYTESSAGEYERSYDTEDDVLGHQRSGLLWTAAESAGNSARNFGEFTQFETKPADATWQKYYCAARSVDAGGDPAALTDPSIRQDTESPIPSLNAITNHDYPKFDTDIPDLYRYGIWKKEFQKNGPANLNTFWLSSDHTGGTPDPEAQVADGDLAVGKIVDTISHSKYWKSSAIFVVEDDSQDGADHVDGHRAPIQIISPYAQHNAVDSRYYTQLTMVRTIEQILGAQPLNQKLAAATPMASAFTTKPDFRPFTTVRNQIPLTEGVATPPACGPDTLGRTGTAARQLQTQQAAKVEVPAAQRGVAAQWQTWRGKQRFTGASAVPDFANPEQMNRYTWYQAHDWAKPYPGDKKIFTPTQVPGAYVPSHQDGD